MQSRVNFVELDATSPDWPVKDGEYEVVLMSYISGSVPESIIAALYKNAYKALKPGGRLLVHDFMVNDSLDSPALGACAMRWDATPHTARATASGGSAEERGARGAQRYLAPIRPRLGTPHHGLDPA